jgi:hypothetical protein
LAAFRVAAEHQQMKGGGWRMSEPTFEEVWNDAGLLREALTSILFNHCDMSGNVAMESVYWYTVNVLVGRIHRLTGIEVKEVWNEAYGEARLMAGGGAQA